MSPTDHPVHAVTGAFGLTGRSIAHRLLKAGLPVRTLTSRPREDSELGRRIDVRPLCFDDVRLLTDSLRNVEVLYNTYWVRYPRVGMTHDRAVENARTLFRCALHAGVRRIVHISITRPSRTSPLSYFHGKAEMEHALIESGLSHAILRPAVLFGGEDILINNVAWMLRRLPVFGIFGDGTYRLQPTLVDDVADLAVRCGADDQNCVLEAVGPEIFSYLELVRMIRAAVHSRARLLHLRPGVGLAIGRALGWLVGDVIITREEIDGLMTNLLIADGPPACPTRFSDWLGQNAARLGIHYASELSRHFGR